MWIYQCANNKTWLVLCGSGPVFYFADNEISSDSLSQESRHWMLRKCSKGDSYMAETVGERSKSTPNHCETMRDPNCNERDILKHVQYFVTNARQTLIDGQPCSKVMQIICAQSAVLRLRTIHSSPASSRSQDYHVMCLAHTITSCSHADIFKVANNCWSTIRKHTRTTPHSHTEIQL